MLLGGISQSHLGSLTMASLVEVYNSVVGQDLRLISVGDWVKLACDYDEVICLLCYTPSIPLSAIKASQKSDLIELKLFESTISRTHYGINYTLVCKMLRGHVTQNGHLEWQNIKCTVPTLFP